MMNEICFDMDGTIANFYGVENWLDYLLKEDTTPYEQAEPLVNMSSFARMVNARQKKGYKLKVISWLSKECSEEFALAITVAKLNWLEKHLPSVKWDCVVIVPYGTPKQNFGNGFLFDDEKPNRDNWNGVAYGVENLLRDLKKIS